MKDSRTSLFPAVFGRITRTFPSLLNLLGIVFVISGIIGLFFVQKPLTETTESRSDASNPTGPVVTSFNPAPGTTLTFDSYLKAPLEFDLTINTAERQVEAIQYVFNIVTAALPEPPEIRINPELNLTSDRSEIQRVGDGYLVSIHLVPKTPGATFSTTGFQKLLTLSFKPSAAGSMTLSFDEQNTFAAVKQGSAVFDGMQSLPVVTYPIEVAEPVSIGGYVPQWATPHVSLTASNFNIKADGKTFLPTGQLYITSDPPSDPTDDYTTFEVSWTTADGTMMRLNMYIYKDDKRWTVEEMRVYNGKNPGDWIYFLPPTIASGSNAGQKISAPIGQPFAPTGDIVFKTSRNGEGEVFFQNLNLKAFLPTDDLSFEGAKPWLVSYKTPEGQAIEPNKLEDGKTYLASGEFSVNNKSPKGNLAQQENVTVRVNVSGQTSASKDVLVSYNLIAQHAQGAVANFKDISFKAGATNSVSTIIDPDNAYSETNENNNYHAVSFNYSGTGGTTKKQCNETCGNNDECKPNHRCYDTGSDKRCRLVTNVSSEGCQAPVAGSKTCNQTCLSSSDCNSALTCWSGVCRNPINVGSTSCSNPSSSTQQTTVTSCNQSCSSNANCPVNLRCYQGVCRLATNVSSNTCNAATTTAISDYYSDTEDTEPKGGDTDGNDTTNEASESGQTASPSAKPVIETPPPSPQASTGAEQNEIVPEASFIEKLKVFFGETGKLATLVIGIGIALLLISILWAIFGGKKRTPPPSIPSTPKESEIKPMVRPPSTMTPMSAPQPPSALSTAPPKPVATITAPPPETPAVGAAGSAGVVGSAVVPRFVAKPGETAYTPSIMPESPASTTTPTSSSMLDRIKQKGVSI